MKYDYLTYRKNLGIDLRNKRQEKELTPEQAAVAIGVNSQTIYRIESAKYKKDVRLYILHEYAKLLEHPFELRIG